MARENRIKEVDRNQQCSPPRGGSNLYDLLPVQRAWGLAYKIAISNGVVSTMTIKNRTYWTYFYCHGGDGESRTRVRKHFRRTFSERS